MSNRKALIARLLRLGITYAPLAYEGLARNRGVIDDLTRRSFGRSGHHEQIAFEHASALIDGSVLGTFDGDTRVWVVFSGERPVGTHPTVNTSVERLLENHDLSLRLTPEEWLDQNEALQNRSLIGSPWEGGLRRSPRAITAGHGATSLAGRLLRRSGRHSTIRGETTSHRTQHGDTDAHGPQDTPRGTPRNTPQDSVRPGSVPTEPNDRTN